MEKLRTSIHIAVEWSTAQAWAW